MVSYLQMRDELTLRPGELRSFRCGEQCGLEYLETGHKPYPSTNCKMQVFDPLFCEFMDLFQKNEILSKKVTDFCPVLFFVFFD